jgi:hypothetical protein
MDAEQMELLERLARLRDLGAISRREFQREKESVVRALPRAAAVHLRALPAPGQASAAVAVVPATAPAPPPRARPVSVPAETTLLQRVGRSAGWILWTLFSIGGLDALLDHDALGALSLLLCGLLVAPPLHRLLGPRMASPTRLVFTAIALFAALGLGAAPSGRSGGPAPMLQPKAATVCGQALSGAARVRVERAQQGILRPWRKFWTDLVWARVAGVSVLEDWRTSRG